jgi:CheY-like chemotaxis protein
MQSSKNIKNNLRPLASINVLVVDDMEFERELTSALLKKIGIRNIQTAENGSTACNKISNAVAVGKPFDIVFSDCNMPGQDGHGLVNWIRSQRNLRDLAIIMITGSWDKEEVLDFIESGANSFVVKPVKEEVLRAKLFEVLGFDKINVA